METALLTHLSSAEQPPSQRSSGSVPGLHSGAILPVWPIGPAAVRWLSGFMRKTKSTAGHIVGVAARFYLFF